MKKFCVDYVQDGELRRELVSDVADSEEAARLFRLGKPDVSEAIVYEVEPSIERWVITGNREKVAQVARDILAACEVGS